MDPHSRDLKKAWKAAQRRASDAELPLPWTTLGGLAETLEVQLAQAPCDHSTRHTEEWAARNGADLKRLLLWARERGGYCDCEILANALDEDRV